MLKNVGLLTVLLFFTSVSSYGDENTIRTELERVYRQFIEAHESGSIEAVKKVRSSFAFGTMINNYAEGRQILDSEKIKAMVKTSPDIFKMRFVKSIVNGPAAGLLYVQDSDFIDASKKPRVEFAFIKFVNEPSGWKVDMIASVGRPKYDSDGKESQFDMGDLPQAIDIDGKVLTAPVLVSMPDAAGFLDINSYGYKTTVLINDVEQYRAAEGGPSRLIKGGLRKGQNKIVIIYEKTNGKSQFGPSVTIRRIFSDNDIREVFNNNPKENIEGKHTFTVRIDE